MCFSFKGWHGCDQSQFAFIYDTVNGIVVGGFNAQDKVGSFSFWTLKSWHGCGPSKKFRISDRATSHRTRFPIKKSPFSTKKFTS
jgi:hypothetical protein